MVHVLRQAAIPTPPHTSVQFEGETYDAGVSFFLVRNDPGQGPRLHRHPYPETWIVRFGLARFTVDGETIDAEAGDIVVAGTGTAHMFRNIGSGPLELVCIHAAGRMETEWLAPAHPCAADAAQA